MNMINIKLVLLHEDTQYSSRLSRCFGEFFPQVEISAFSSIDIIIEAVSRMSADVLLVSEYFYDKQKSKLAAVKARCRVFIILTKSSGINKLGEYPAICQYRMIDNLYSEIISVYAEKTNALLNMSSDTGKTTVCTFMSGAGGCGCSTAAAAYSVYLASRGNKIIYVDMNPLGMPELMFDGDGSYTLTDCFTALLSKKNNLNVQLETYSIKDISNVHFYSSCVNSLDWSDITFENRTEFLDTLISGSNYDHVIVDLPSVWDNISAFMYKKSDNFFVVSNGRKIENARNVKLIDMIFTFIRSENADPSKLKIVYSDYSGISVKLQDNRTDEYTVLPEISKFRNARELLDILSASDIWER